MATNYLLHNQSEIMTYFTHCIPLFHPTISATSYGKGMYFAGDASSSAGYAVSSAGLGIADSRTDRRIHQREQ